MVLISHDRHFVRQTATKIWFIEDFEIKEYPGTYDEYVKWNETRDANLKSTPAAKVIKNIAAPIKPFAKPIEDKNTKKLKKEIEVLEKEIETFEKEIQTVELLLASEEVYSNKSELQTHTQKHTTLINALTLKQNSWESKMMELEN